MDPDMLLIFGLVICLLAIPSMISAWSDDRSLRLTFVTLLIGAGMVAGAYMLQPGGYRVAQIPDVFYGVVAKLMP